MTFQKLIANPVIVWLVVVVSWVSVVVLIFQVISHTPFILLVILVAGIALCFSAIGLVEVWKGEETIKATKSVPSNVVPIPRPTETTEAIPQPKIGPASIAPSAPVPQTSSPSPVPQTPA